MAEDPRQLLLEEEKEYKRTYRLSLWWVQHRAKIVRLGYGLFIAFDTVLILFVLWTFLDTYALSYGKEMTAVQQVVRQGVQDLRSYTIARSATELQQEDVRLFSIGDNRYDFYAMLSNENQDWWVEFDYAFAYEDKETPKQHAVFLPTERKPVASLAITSQTSLRTTELLLSNIVWHRVDHHAIGDYQTWFAKRSALEFSEMSFTKETSPTQTIGISHFTVENRTAYSYFNPTFYVLLKQGSSVVGVNRLTLASLDSLETKQVSLNWFGTIPAVTTVEVIADIAYFDPTIYKQAKGTFGDDVRLRIE